MKKLLSAVLALAMVFSLISTGVQTAWATAPTQFGKLFAGYYTDSTYKTASETATSYPKFVDENVMQVKYQFTLGTTENDSSTKLRVVTTVDSLNYQAVGLHVWVGNTRIDTNGDEFRTKRVTSKVTATTGLGELEYQPTDFCASSKYFFAFNFNVTGGSAKFDQALKFQPYWITKDGTEVTSTLYGGNGTRSIVISDSEYYNNILVYNATDLKSVATQSASNNFEGWTIRLMNDIDLNPGFTASTTGFTDGKGGTPTQWTSIGSTSKYFKGTFDGDGHTISGMYLNSTTHTGNLYLGLFGATSGVSTVKDFRLENSYIYTKGARNGSIAGTGDGTFEDIYSNAIIVTEGGNATAIGGMIGYFDGGTNVSYSGLHFDGTVTGSGYYVGGILGQAANSAKTTLTIENCRNSGTVYSSDVGTGSMVGLVETTASSTVVNITGCWNEGSVSAKNGVQGTFVGRSRGDGAPTVNVSDCLNSFVNALNPVGSQVTGTVTVQRVLSARTSDVKIWKSGGETTSASASELAGSAARTVLMPYGFDFTTAWGSRAGDVPVPKHFAVGGSDLWDANGTQADPYVIKTAAELRDFADASQTNNFEGKYIKLGADIDLNPGFTASTGGFSDGGGGTPVKFTGIGSTSKYFKGNFDGQGHTISGLYQATTVTFTSATNVYLGLFAATGGSSTVKNFRLENSYIYSRGARVGSIAGNGDGNFQDIYSDAIIVTEGGYAAAIGGMIGYFDGSTSATYSGLQFDGTVTGSGYWVGGILGEANNSAGTTLTMENCYNSGTVSSSDTVAGSIMGYGISAGASAVVNLTGCWNSGSVSAPSSQGIFVGRTNSSNLTVNISNCLNSYANSLNPVGSQAAGAVNVQCVLSARTGDVKIWKSNGATTSVAPSALAGSSARVVLIPYGFDFPVNWVTRVGNLPIPRHFTVDEPTLWDAAGTQGDPYVLSTAADLQEFAARSQSDSFEGKYIKLDADIDLNPGWTANASGGTGATPTKFTSIGSTSKYFKGNFDGQGHTISGLYQATTVTFTSATNVYLGLFAATSAASTVKNFRLENSYIYSRGARVGSIAGTGDGRFEDIYSDAIIVTEGGYAAAIGGMIGYFDGSTSVAYSDLHFDGTVTGSGYWVGGILGQASNGANTTLTIENCRNSGTVSSSDTVAGSIMGYGISAGASAVVNLTGCWNSGSVSAPSSQGIFVGRTNSSNLTVNISNCLNSFVTSLNPVGSQAAGTVNVQCVLSARTGDIKIWKNNSATTSATSSALAGTSARAVLIPYGFDFSTAWGARVDDIPVPKYFATDEPVDAWSAAGTQSDPYLLMTAGDLQEFAARSQTDNFDGKYIKLGADIDLNPGFTASTTGFTDGNGGTPTKWTSIGSTSKYFKGNFDGQGHTISGLYQTTTVVFTSTTNVYLGLFAATSASSTVKNFRLENSYIYSRGARVGSIAGNGDGVFQNIYSNAIIVTEGGYAAAIGGMIGYFDGSTSITYSDLHYDGTLTGSGYHVGGILGRASNSANTTLTIANCRNSGTVSSSDTMAGGILGLLDTTALSVTVNLTGCWNSGTVSAPSSRGFFMGVVRNGSPKVNISDCLNSFATTLNPIGSQQSGTVSYQRILGVRSDDIKVWDGSGATFAVAPSNTTGLSLMPYGFDFVTAWAARAGEYPLPAAFAPSATVVPDTSWYTGSGPYVLNDADDLYGFAVLSQSNSFAGKTVKLGADINMNPGWTANANGGTGTTPMACAPIGSSTSSFAGTFDGQGHTISGLYLATGAANGGLFSSIGTNGTVKDLRLTNSTLIGDDQYLGSIAGQSKGTIRNVYSSAIVKSSKGRVGGLVGGVCNASAVLEKCWFGGTVINTGNTSAVQGTGGLVGYVNNDSAGSLTLRNCLVSGAVDVTAYTANTAAVAGGLLGYVHTNTTLTIEGCLASGSISYDDSVVTGLLGPVAGLVEDGDSNNVLLLSRTYAVDSIPSLIGTHVVSGENFDFNVPVGDSFVYVSASSIIGASAQTAMPLLGWGTDWKYVSGQRPELNFDSTAAAVSLAVTSSDASALNSLYSGRTLYQGELHDHADTSIGSDNGTSDGYVELTQWYTEMPILGMDFAASLDHQQTRHINESSWDKSKLLYGSEASTNIPNVTNSKKNAHHYNMLFRTQAQFETVLNAFTEFNYKGWNGIPNWMFNPDGRTNCGSADFKYPNFTRARFAELIQAVQNAGGFMVLPHAFCTDTSNSNQALDYNFGVAGVGFDVIYAYNNHNTDNQLYAGWKELLANGAKMYATAGTDGHSDLQNTALTSVYGASAAATDKGYLLDQLRVGDFTAGSAGIKMSVGTTAMGGTCSFSGKRVVVDVAKLHTITNDLSHNYRLDVISDKGVVYSMKLTVNSDGTVGSGAEIAFNADASSAFYRVVVVDCTTRIRVAIGNPIWNG